jgi:Ca2+-binding EF-hand superfamily protein
MTSTGFGVLAAALALGVFLAPAPAIAQTTPAPDLRAWVKKYDKNRDGKLDRGEFHQAVVDAFFLRDKDKNGYLAISELKEASPEAIKAVKRKNDARISLEEYVNALFKDFEAADTDGDGLLTAEEIEDVPAEGPVDGAPRPTARLAWREPEARQGARADRHREEGAAGRAEHTLRRTSPDGIHEAVTPRRRHHDELRGPGPDAADKLIDRVSRLRLPLPAPIAALRRGDGGEGALAHVEQAKRHRVVPDERRERDRGVDRGLRRRRVVHRHEDAPEVESAGGRRHEAGRALGDEERDLARVLADGRGHAGLAPGGEAIARVRGHHDDVGGMLAEELGGLRHWIGGRGLDLLDIDAELGHRGGGLPGGSTPQRSSASRTPGKCFHPPGPASGATWRIRSSPLVSSVSFSACAKASSLASEKSVGCRKRQLTYWPAFSPMSYARISSSLRAFQTRRLLAP